MIDYIFQAIKSSNCIQNDRIKIKVTTKSMRHDKLEQQADSHSHNNRIFPGNIYLDDQLDIENCIIKTLI